MMDNPAYRKMMHDYYMSNPQLRAVLRHEAVVRHTKQMIRLGNRGLLTDEIALGHVLSVVEYFDYDGWRY